MAGKPKKRIDYAGWSVDMFTSDTKIDKLLDAQSWTGFGIYFYLCQMAFGNEGYFYEWCYDLCATTARKMGGGVGAGTVKEAVDCCLHIGLFDKGLFDRWGVLTSRGIQKSYLIVLKSKNRQGTEVYSDYWLLDKNDKDCQGVFFVPKKSVISTEYSHSLAEHEHSLGGYRHSLAQEDSKVKESKDIFVDAAPGAGATVFFPDDQFEMRCVEKLIKSNLENFPNSKVPVTYKEKEKWSIEFDRMKRLDKRSEAEILQALEFAVTDSFWKTNIRSSKKFREKFETLYIQSMKYGKHNKEEVKQRDPIESDRFAAIDPEIRLQFESLGIINNQSLNLGNADDEQVRYLQRLGLL